MSWFEVEAELERFVLADAADGRYDEQLVPVFHRRNLRAQLLLGPEGSAMTRHVPIQRFRRVAMTFAAAVGRRGTREGG